MDRPPNPGDPYYRVRPHRRVLCVRVAGAQGAQHPLGGRQQQDFAVCVRTSR